MSNEPVTIKYRKTGPDAVEPVRGSDGAAGYDLVCAADTELVAYRPTMVPTRLAASIPPGYCMLVLPRSGRAVKTTTIIPNSPGLIDSDYRGEWQGIFTYIPNPNLLLADALLKQPTSSIWIRKGEKMAQLLLIRYHEQRWELTDELDETGRGQGGFGSTDPDGSAVKPGTRDTAGGQGDRS